MNTQTAGTSIFGAHEIIVMHEALSTKAANIEMLSLMRQQTTDPTLQNIVDRQVQNIAQQYQIGVELLQRGMQGGVGMNTQYGSTVNPTQMPVHMAQIGTQPPQLGLRNPYIPAPQAHGRALSERALCTILLNLHKFGAVSKMQYALECVDTDLRQYLVNGSLNCDKMAYEVWNYMNQRGLYQVPTLMPNTTQTLIQSFQPQAQINMQPGQQYQQ